MTTSIEGADINLLDISPVFGRFSIERLEKSGLDLLSFAYTVAEATIIKTKGTVFLENSPYYFIVKQHQKVEGKVHRCELWLQGIIYDEGANTHYVDVVDTGLLFYSIHGRNYITDAYANAWVLLND
jgi:hypothetical protein